MKRMQVHTDFYDERDICLLYEFKPGLWTKASLRRALAHSHVKSTEQVPRPLLLEVCRNTFYAQLCRVSMSLDRGRLDPGFTG